MPELPEVERIRMGLESFLPGRRIVSAAVDWPKTLATHSPDDLAHAIQNLRFGSVARRAKYLILSLPPYSLLVHLRMTGRLYAASSPDPEWEQHPHVRMILNLDGDARLYLQDVRKFARVYLTTDPDAILAGLGPEPLDDALSPAAFATDITGHRRQLKPLLLDQHVIAGLGNIYVDETLWRSRLHPLRTSDTLTEAEAVALYVSMRAVLREAIAHGGTTLRDYRGADDTPGSHQFALAVYGRAGQPCPRCGTPIIRTVVGQRGTHLCPVCQPEPPAKGDGDG